MDTFLVALVFFLAGLVVGTALGVWLSRAVDRGMMDVLDPGRNGPPFPAGGPNADDWEPPQYQKPPRRTMWDDKAI